MSKICTLDIVNGYVINQIRLEAGYKKQGELGEKFGMSHAAVGKIERGESSVSLEFLTILAEMIGTRASKIVAVTEELTDYLKANEVVFMSQTSYNVINDLMKEQNDSESQKQLIVPTNFEDHISLELKKSVRSLVTQKPDMDVTDVQEQMQLGAVSLGNHLTSGSGFAMAAAVTTLVNPLLGIGIGASLLATKLLKNKKAP